MLRKKTDKRLKCIIIEQALLSANLVKLQEFALINAAVINTAVLVP